MTLGRALSYAAAFVLLTVYYVAAERPWAQATPVVAKPVPLLGVSAADVAAVEVESNDHHFRAVRNAGEWRVEEPAGGRVSGDLIPALVSNLCELTPLERVATGEANAADFGLDQPHARITLKRADGSAVVMAIGLRNPAQTAVYAQRAGAADIVLIGGSVQYYIDLIFGSVTQAEPS